MKLAFAGIFYAAAFTFIYAACFGMPDAWEQLNHGWPQTPEAITCALLIANGLFVKLAGHVCLLSTSRAR